MVFVLYVSHISFLWSFFTFFLFLVIHVIFIILLFLLYWHFSYFCVFVSYCSMHFDLSYSTLKYILLFSIIVWSIWKSYNNILLFTTLLLFAYICVFVCIIFGIYYLLFLVSFTFCSTSGFFMVSFSSE